MSSNIPGEPAVSAVAFDALERDFVEVMRELSAEDSLERFRLEYEKLHRALKKSHESEKRLIKRCQEMNKEIVENLNRMERSLEEEIFSLRNNLTMQVLLLDKNLKNFREKNEQEIGALNSLIDEIEKQSDIQLKEIKDELKTIQVKSKDFSAIIDDVLQSVVSIGTDRGQGSGVVVDDRGFIVTNFHVIDDASIIRILTYENDVYDANLIDYNEVMDLASY